LLRDTRIVLWRVGALAAVGVGAVAVAVPVLPTVPFLILAAWAASKGWPSLEQRLLAHPQYGQHIRNWRERGAVPRRAKWLATIMMSISVFALQLSTAPAWIKLGAPLLMLAVAIWLWTRPEP